jgi:hypothetical protein
MPISGHVVYSQFCASKSDWSICNKDLSLLTSEIQNIFIWSFTKQNNIKQNKTKIMTSALEGAYTIIVLVENL